MGTKIKATVVAAALAGAMLVAPAAEAAPVQEARLAAASSSDCPWWVANGYWKVIWYWGTGQCSPRLGR